MEATTTTLHDFSEEIAQLKTSSVFARPTSFHYRNPPYDFETSEPVEDSWAIALSGLTEEQKLEWRPNTVTLYPLPYRGRHELPSGQDAIELLDHTTLIEQGDGFYLALTSSGPDMRWEICNSYVRLGFLPPAYFATGFRPVEGRGESPEDKLLLAACRRSLVFVRDEKQKDLQVFLDRFQLQLAGVRAVVG